MFNFTNISRLVNLALFTFVALDIPVWASYIRDNPRLVIPAGPPEQLEYYQNVTSNIGLPLIEEKYEQVIQRDKEVPTHTKILPGWDLLSFEATISQRHFHVLIAYNKLADKFKTRPKIQRQYLEQGIKSLEPYFIYVQNAPAIDKLSEETRNQIICLRQGLFTGKAVVKSSLYELADSSEKLPFCKEVILANRESIRYLELVANIDSALKEGAKEKLPVEKFNLFQLYCNLTTFTLEDEPLKQARELRDELKTLNPFLFEKAQKFLNITVDELSSLRKQAQQTKKAAGRQGPKTAKFLAEKSQKEQREIRKAKDELSTELSGMRITKSFNKQIEDIYMGIGRHDFSSPNVYKEIESTLHEIETRIFKELGLEGPLDEDNLKRVYACLVELLPEDMWIKSLPKCVTFLTEVDNVDGAILRLGILKKLQEAKSGKATRLTCMYYAYLKTLNGEYEDWLALENELTEEQQRKAAEKKARKAAAKEKFIEDLKAASATPSVTPVPKKESAVQPATTPIRDDKGKEEASYEYDGGSAVDSKKEKQEKLKRHLENQQQRQDQNNHVPAAVSRSLPAKVELIPVDEKPSESLIELYGLTGVARDVELKILQGDWNIKKEDLAAYFEAMGCIHKPGGRGSHTKVKLNGSVHVEKDGEIMTIFVGAGGALTLPVWDQGHIKPYLIKQVLVAREKLLRKALIAKHQLKFAKG